MRRVICLGAVLTALWLPSPSAIAQLAPSAATVPPATPASAAAAAGQGQGFFARFCVAFKACKRKLCATPLGQLLNGITQPLTTLTGGVIPPFCPITPSLEDLAKPGVEGAAAQAKKDALEAKARRAAVRFLGTLDCRYNPEAEEALIAALRTDRIECVRYEAALALLNGCCCTKNVIEALLITVSGSEEDGNPAERSLRVRDAAFHALHRCMACFTEPAMKTDGPQDPPPAQEPKNSEQPPKKEIPKGEDELEVNVESARPVAPHAHAIPKPSLRERSLTAMAKYAAFRQNAARQVRQEQPPIAEERSLFNLMEDAWIQQDAARTVAPMIPPPPTTTAPLATMVHQHSPTRLPNKPIPPETSTPTPVAAASVSAYRAKRESHRMGMMNPETVATHPLVEILTHNTNPTQRHYAAIELSHLGWEHHPEVVPALLRSARLDRDRRVRVSCIRQLAAIGADTSLVQHHLAYLQQEDSDAWIRLEATHALRSLAGQR